MHFTKICDYFAVAASVWWMLQVFDGFFPTRRAGKRTGREKALLTAFSVLSHWGMAVLSRYLENEITLLAVLAIMSIGVHMTYECRYLDVVCLNILGWGVLILGDLFFLLCFHFLYGRRGAIPASIPVPNEPLAEGLYLAAAGILLLCLGSPLKRWISDKRYLIFRYRKACYLLVFVMLPCILYAQWISWQKKEGLALEGWFLLPLYGMAVFFFYRFSVMKQKIDEADRMQRMKIEMLEDNYQMLLEIYREREILLHDMKNHMRTILAMIGNGQSKKAAAYIEQITGGMSRSAKMVWTNHEILDLILNMKFQEARKAQIEVQCRCDDMSGLLLSSSEICALFSNLLDNAIEANEKCPPDMGRRMSVLCTRQESMLVASVSNLIPEDAAGQGRTTLETTKQDKAIHGFGLQSIQKILDSHNGYRKVNVAGREFCIVVYLVGFETPPAV